MKLVPAMTVEDATVLPLQFDHQEVDRWVDRRYRERRMKESGAWR